MIKPDRMGVNVKNKDQMKVKFPSWDLEAGTCYKLDIDTEAIVLRSGKKVEAENFDHEYCTSDCHCNPYSMAICNENMECECQEPYTGVSCGDC